MRISKCLTLLLVALLAAGMCASCASNDPEPPAVASSAPDTVEAVDSATPEPEPVAEPADDAASEAPAEPVELVVFAAASMTETLQEIQSTYATIAPHVTLLFNFDSSGTLKTQIQEGAEADIFISAGKKQVDELDIQADPAVNVDSLDFISPESRFDLLTNQVVLIVPKGSDKGLSSFADAATDKVSLIALGNSDVPVGQYAQDVYTSLGLWDQMNENQKITFASNVKEVLEQVNSLAVDCGVVYSTDAATSDGVEIVCAAPEGSHKPVVYPAAIIKTSQHPDEAQAFLEYLKGPEATAVFESVGFSIPNR